MTNSAYNTSIKESKKPIFDGIKGYIFSTCSKKDTFKKRTMNNEVMIMKNEGLYLFT